jgi:hypothetical protein
MLAFFNHPTEIGMIFHTPLQINQKSPATK